MKTLRLKPVYGYGWQEDGITIDTPRPFNLRVYDYRLADDKKHYARVLGKVASLLHKYRGKWVLLSVRTLGEMPSYNVCVYRQKPTTSEALDETGDVRIVATGFAEVR